MNRSWPFFPIPGFRRRVLAILGHTAGSAYRSGFRAAWNLTSICAVAALWLFAPEAAVSDPAVTPEAAQTGTIVFHSWLDAVPLFCVALVVTIFVFYLWHLRSDFLKTCVQEKQLALFVQSPAGLPEGTIRGAIAFLIVICSLLFFALPGLRFPEALGSVLGTILGFYFGTRGQTRDSDSVVAKQMQEVTAQRDEAVAEKEVSDTGSVLDKLESGADIARRVASVLPESVGGKYVEMANTVQQGISAVKGLLGEGKSEQALESAGKAAENLTASSPLTEIVGSALKSFGGVLGTAMPPAGIIAAIVAGTVKLTGIYYQKWKARVLHMPFSPATGLSLEMVDDNTGFMLIQKSPVLRDAFQLELGNPKFLTEAVRDFLRSDSTDQLFETYANYGGKPRFETIQQFEVGLDEFYRAAADNELKPLILAREPTLLGNTGGYDSVMAAVDKLHENPDALKDLDSLVLITEKLQADDKPVASMIDETLSRLAGGQ